MVIWAFGFAGPRCSTYIFRNLLSLLSLGFLSPMLGSGASYTMATMPTGNPSL